MVKKYLKVLYVADTFLPKKDGVVRFMLETSSRFKKSVQISFLVPKFRGAQKACKDLKYKCYVSPITSFKIADYPAAIPASEIIKKAVDQNDIIFIQSIAPLGAKTLSYAKSKNKKTIEYIHSIDWKLLPYALDFGFKATGILKTIARRLYNKNDLILVSDKSIKKELKKIKVTAPIEIVPLGVDTKKFRPDNKKRLRIRKKLNFTNNFVIGFLGRVSKEKNIKLLINSFKKIKTKIPNAKLLIVGSGPLEKEIKKDPDIILTGFINNPQDYLKAMDVFVLPSDTETSALALMEAMATGLPCIASAVGGIPAYVKSGQNGLLIRKKSLSQKTINKAILRIYDDCALRTKLAKNAAKTIKNKFDWKKTASAIEKKFFNVFNK